MQEVNLRRPLFANNEEDHHVGESGISPYEIRNYHNSNLHILDNQRQVHQLNTTTPNLKMENLNLNKAIKKNNEKIKDLEWKYLMCHNKLKQCKSFITKIYDYLHIKRPSFKEDISLVDVTELFESNDVIKDVSE